jgi:hypothetical protein
LLLSKDPERLSIYEVCHAADEQGLDALSSEQRTVVHTHTPRKKTGHDHASWRTRPAESPSRFRRARDAGAYLGLVPRRHESGGHAPELRISKAGDKTLRRLLVAASHYVLGPFGPDTDLRRWGLALAGRGGKTAKKRAVVATARKLSVLLLSLWRSGEVYEPLRGARQPAATVEA